MLFESFLSFPFFFSVSCLKFCRMVKEHEIYEKKNENENDYI